MIATTAAARVHWARPTTDGPIAKQQQQGQFLLPANHQHKDDHHHPQIEKTLKCFLPFPNVYEKKIKEVTPTILDSAFAFGSFQKTHKIDSASIHKTVSNMIRINTRSSWKWPWSVLVLDLNLYCIPSADRGKFKEMRLHQKKNANNFSK